MTDELEHHGILGMHWGKRQGSSSSSGSTTDSKKVGFSSESLGEKVKKTPKEKILSGKRVAKGILVAYGALAVYSAVEHLHNHPITVTVDYTNPPFKWKKPPFYNVKVGKSIARKLLPGG